MYIGGVSSASVISPTTAAMMPHPPPTSDFNNFSSTAVRNSGSELHVSLPFQQIEGRRTNFLTKQRLMREKLLESSPQVHQANAVGVAKARLAARRRKHARHIRITLDDVLNQVSSSFFFFFLFSNFNLFLFFLFFFFFFFYCCYFFY
jgi:hypothetical protein